MITAHQESTAGFPAAFRTFAALTLTLTVAACNRSSAESKPPAAEAPPVAIERARVEPIKVPRVLTLSGTLVGAEQARVAAGAAGKVLATSIERGSVVKKGAVMVRLDSRTLTAQAKEAQAQVESLKAQEAQAKLDCERTQQMFDKGAISKADYDRSRTQCQTTKWSVSAAEARRTQTAEALRDTEIRAPFTGMIVERNVSAGEYVRPDSPVATLVAVDALRVELTVPEADVTQVRQGMAVEFRVAADDKSPAHQGRVRYIGPAVRQQTRDAVVEAEVDNVGRDLRPGMFVTAKLALGEQTLPSVPQTAVRADGVQRHVFVVVDGRLEDRLVQLGDAKDGRVAVVNGVKNGEQVVAQVTPDVRDGAKVK
jgi:membrane fusion protein (multidrug efflux system)